MVYSPRMLHIVVVIYILQLDSRVVVSVRIVIWPLLLRQFFGGKFAYIIYPLDTYTASMVSVVLCQAGGL